jgi:hypothetical protein
MSGDRLELRCASLDLEGAIVAFRVRITSPGPLPSERQRSHFPAIVFRFWFPIGTGYSRNEFFSAILPHVATVRERPAFYYQLHGAALGARHNVAIAINVAIVWVRQVRSVEPRDKYWETAVSRANSSTRHVAYDPKLISRAGKILRWNRG